MDDNGESDIDPNGDLDMVDADDGVNDCEDISEDPNDMDGNGNGSEVDGEGDQTKCKKRSGCGHKRIRIGHKGKGRRYSYGRYSYGGHK